MPCRLVIAWARWTTQNSRRHTARHGPTRPDMARVGPCVRGTDAVGGQGETRQLPSKNIERKREHYLFIVIDSLFWVGCRATLTARQM